MANDCATGLTDRLAIRLARILLDNGKNVTLGPRPTSRACKSGAGAWARQYSGDTKVF